MSDRSKKPGADWISWTGQYIFGLLFGVGLGWIGICMVIDDLPDSMLPAWMMEFCLGSGFFFAGLAAFYGDNLWYHLIDYHSTTEGHRHSKRSAKLAALSFVLGVGIMIAVVMKWMGWVA